MDRSNVERIEISHAYPATDDLHYVALEAFYFPSLSHYTASAPGAVVSTNTKSGYNESTKGTVVTNHMSDSRSARDIPVYAGTCWPAEFTTYQC